MESRTELRTRNIAVFSILLLGIVLLAGCTGEGGGDRGDLTTRKVNIVTTVGMIADLAANIGGERVEVVGLMGPGIDPHLYKASAGDVDKMQRADIIFYNGLHLEGAMAELFEQMASRRLTVAVAGEIDPERLLSQPGNAEAHDPHVWFDVQLWDQAALVVEGSLVTLDPGHAELYRQNAAAYREELAALDAYVRERASTVPADQRVLITAHDAFHYFGRAYEFEVYGLQGISTVAEAGTSDVQELAAFIATRRIPAIFVESSVPPRTIKALQAAVNAKGFKVRIGGELFSDAMGDPNTPEGTYQGMVRHNIDTIVDALTGVNH